MKTEQPSASHREQLLAILDFFSAHHLRQEDSALVLADGTLSITAANHTHTYTITVKPINYEAP